MAGKFSTWLNQSLYKLNSKEGLSIKIQNPKEIGFNVKDLLKEIISIYVNFVGNESFYMAIASDDMY